MRRFFLSLLIVLFDVAGWAQVVAPRSGSAQLLIPAAGAVTGASGEVFRSDITLLNYRNRDQVVQIRWLPRGASGLGLAPVQITMLAGTGIISEDFVTTVVQQTGLGALLITAVTDTGTPDPGGHLFATSRIWSNQPGSSGTVSQTFPVIATTDINSAPAVSIAGLRRDSRYHLNVGIVNLDATTQTFGITIGGTGGQTLGLTVPPLSMNQIGITGAEVTPLQINVSNVTTPQFGNWVAYGSSVDNVTNDSWSAIGFVPTLAP